MKISNAILVILIALVMVALSSQPALADGGDVTWEYGDTPQTGKQEAVAMAVDSDGNTIIAGTTDQYGTNDYYTVKILANGSGVSWSKPVDKNSNDDHATALVIDSENNVIVTGYVWSGTSYDFHTIKYDGSDGTVLWEHTFNAPINGNDHATAIAVDSSDKVYVGGYSQGSGGDDDYMIVKYGKDGPNPDGTPIWTQSYNGPADLNDKITAITAGGDGIAVTGESQNATPDFDIYTVKYGFDKSFVWEKRKSVSGDDKGIAVHMDAAGDVIMTGMTYNGSNADIYIVQYNTATGAEEWQHTYSNGLNEEPADLFVDSLGNVYVTGYISVAGEGKNIYTLMFNSSGVEQWTDPYNSANDNNDTGISIVADESGDVFVTGNTYDNTAGNYNYQTLKYAKGSGSLLWPVTSFDGSASKNDQVVGVGITSSGEPIVAGWSDKWTSGASDYDYYAIKYDPGLLNAPTDLDAVTISTSRIDLVWTVNSVNEDGFKIERKIGDFGTWSEITTKGIGVSAHSDTGLTADIIYYYRVKAYNAADGDSHYSNEDYAVTTIFTYSTPSITYIYDAPYSGDDFVTALASGPDNTPVITGYSDSTEQFDYYTVKRHKDTLALVWEARYNGDQDGSDKAMSLTVDGNNDVLVTGRSVIYSAESNGNSNDIYSIKYPSTGLPKDWSDPYNGPAADDDRSSVVAVSTDGDNNYAVVGYGKNANWDDDIYVIKYLSDGTTDWEAVPYDRGVTGNDYPSAVAFDSSGDIFVAGYTSNGTNDDYFVRKYDGADGSEIWIDNYNIANTGNDYARSLSVNSDGDVYVTGTAVTASGNEDFYTIKYDGANGDILWEEPFNGVNNGTDEAWSVWSDPVDGGAVVAGTTVDSGGDHEFHIIKYETTDGTVAWERTVDRSGSHDYVTAMAMDNSGNLHVTGYTDNGTNKDALSVQYDSDGTFLGGSIYNGSADKDDEGAAVTVNDLGEAFVGGYSRNAGNDADYLVYKVTNNLLQTPIPVTAIPVYEEVEINWSNNSIDEAGFHLEKKTDVCASAKPWTSLYTAAADEITYTDTNLAIGEPYCYRVRTYKNNGEISRWAEIAVTTLNPAAPVLTVTAVNTTRIDLSWTNSTVVEDGFRIERCEGASCTDFAEIDTTGADVTTYSDNSLCSGRTYRYQVKAYRTSHWATGYSNIASDATSALPATGTTLTATRVSEAEIELTWTDAIGDETGYKIERCAGSGCSNFVEVDINVTTYLKALYHMDETTWDGTVDEIADSTHYDNHGIAVDGAVTDAGGHAGRAGNFDGTGYADMGDTADLRLSSGNAFTIEGWFKPSVNVTSMADTDPQLISKRPNLAGGYAAHFTKSDGKVNVQYCWSGGCLTATSTTVFTAGSWYHYAGTYDGSDLKLYINNVLEATEPASQSMGPSSGTSLHVGNKYEGIIDEVRIYSRALTVDEIDDHFNDITDKARYSATGIDNDITYNYRIRAYKTATCEGGWDSPSYSNTNEATATLVDPSDLSATGANTTQIDFSWTNDTGSETSFDIERCEGGSCDFSTVATLSASAGASTYSDTYVCQGITYKYRLKAIKDDEAPLWETGWTDPVAQASTVSAVAPASLSATMASESQIELEWTYTTFDETGQKIQRCEGTVASCADGDFSTVETYNTVYGTAMVMHMDEDSWDGASYDVIDSSTNTNNGRAYNGADTVADGKFGRAGSFDGSNDYIYVPHNSSINPTNEITVAVWAKSNVGNWNNYYNFASKRNAFMLGPQSGTKRVYFYVYVNNGWRYAYYTPTFDITEWHHYAGTYDGTTIRLFIDGSEVASTTYAGTINSDTGYLSIGRDDGYSRYFNGLLDEVVIFDRALTEAEITAFHTKPVNPRTYSDTGLQPGTFYTYRVNSFKTATCEGGWELSSNEDDDQTQTLPAPENLQANDINTTRIDLTWDDMTNSETGFTIERCEGASCDFSTTTTFTVGEGVEAYSDIEACQSKTYKYRVKAVREGTPPLWNTGWTDPVAQATTPAAADAAGLTLTAVSETEVELQWTDNTADESGFKVERCTNSGCSAFSSVKTLGEVYGETMKLHMDETSWNGASYDVIDSSTNTNNGRAYNGANTVADGKYSGAGSFDGTNDYISVPHNITINPSDAITVSLWAKSDTTNWNDSNVLASKRNAYMMAPVSGSKQIRFYVYTTTWYYALFTPSIDIKEWHHYAGTYDGANIRLYIDGSEVASSARTGEINADTGVLMIGRDDGSTLYFDGQIDEVAIYDRALLDTEVDAVYNSWVYDTKFVDTGLTQGETYRYRLYAYKDAGEPACDWETAYLETEVTMDPPAPGNFSATTQNTTEITLTWEDRTDNETSFTIERCAGAGCDFSTKDTFTASADDTSYSDTAACESITYEYRIKAVNSGVEWVETGWSIAQGTASSKAAPSGLAATAVSEMQINLSWDDNTGDATGYRIERCPGSCSNFVEIGTSTLNSYQDKGLTPGATYTYQVRAYKTATCSGGWTSGYSNTHFAETQSADSPTVLSASGVNTTQIDLSWTTNTDYETGFLIERCEGGGCSNFAELTTVGPVTSYSDTDACKTKTYRYRVMARNQGLSNHADGCWTARVPIAITGFQSDYYQNRLDITHGDHTGMNADFSDIRFYDETAKVELPYWIETKDDGVSATVWFKTYSHDNVYMYYGNTDAASSTRTSSFYEFYHTFQGTTIDSSIWVEIDEINAFQQNDGLNIYDKKDDWNTALISQQTYTRTDGKEIYVSLSIPADTAGVNEFALGWALNQTANAEETRLVHGVYFNNYTLSIFEKGFTGSVESKTYAASTDYEIRIQLKTAGAKYYIKGGAYGDWTLLQETSDYTDATMRLAIMNESHEATIHKIIVRDAPADTEPVVTTDTEETSACYAFTNTWDSIGYSNEDEASTDTPTSATVLTATTATDTQIDLSWTYTTADETGFKIERCVEGSCTFGQIHATTSNDKVYSDTTASPEITYCYRVRAYKTASCEGGWDTAYTNEPCDMTVSGSPTVLNAVVDGSMKIILSWTDNANDEDGYEIEVKIWNGEFMKIATVEADIVTYTDTESIKPEEQYTYRVRAYRALEKSGYSNEASVTTPEYTEGDDTCE